MHFDPVQETTPSIPLSEQILRPLCQHFWSHEGLKFWQPFVRRIVFGSDSTESTVVGFVTLNGMFLSREGRRTASASRMSLAVDAFSVTRRTRLSVLRFPQYAIFAEYEKAIYSNLMASVLWYYNAEQIETDPATVSPPIADKELFASRHIDVVPLDTIEEIIFVITFNEFARCLMLCYEPVASRTVMSKIEAFKGRRKIERGEGAEKENGEGKKMKLERMAEGKLLSAKISLQLFLILLLIVASKAISRFYAVFDNFILVIGFPRPDHALPERYFCNINSPTERYELRSAHMVHIVLCTQSAVWPNAYLCLIAKFFGTLSPRTMLNSLFLSHSVIPYSYRLCLRFENFLKCSAVTPVTIILSRPLHEKCSLLLKHDEVKGRFQLSSQAYAPLP
uniref:Uncharacterized protein n=1 Tax=Parascaris equorum TaxID=6256 RepID=A0A914RHP6_PAREQ